MRTLVTLNDIFFRIAFETGPRAILYLDPGGSWVPLSGMKVYSRVRALATAFKKWGLVKGDRVALLSENRWEWAVTDFACLSLGLVDVPIFPTLQPELTSDLLAHCGARVVVVSTRQQYEKAIRGKSSIERVIAMDEQAATGADVVSFASLMPQAEREPQRDLDFEAGAKAIEPDDLATIIYTSGTTGEPKGVMLTHGNLAENLNYSLREFSFLPEDSSISFLPLSHVTARHVDYALYSEKVAIAYVPTLDKLMPAIKAVQPTFFVAVPRVYEKIRQEVERRASKSAVKKRIVAWALATGARNRRDLEGGTQPASLAWRLAERLFYSKVRETFGGRVRHYIAGGAPLGLDSATWFLNAGVRILEGYGLTETSPVLGVNTPTHYRMGSVGRVLPNIEAKVAEDGELLVRGPNVFKGYWQHAEMTSAAFDQDGWFLTGDIARIDDERYLFITDRKKELIKTSAGKLVAPQPIEGKLKADSFVSQAALVGDREKYVAALLSPNFAALEPWAREQGIAAATRKELVEHPAVEARYRETIKRVNRTLADYEVLKRFVVVPEEWSQETGELTPKLQVKRRVLAEQYRDEIAALFR
ncbi:MAG TPA: long-chain fatty acid--CoA ligase [Acidobacteriaceae bacterium]